MDLSAIIVVVICIIVFFGGVAWLEIHSRKKRGPARQGRHSPRLDVSTVSVEETVRGREAESG
jgi:hypothetical protein